MVQVEGMEGELEVVMREDMVEDTAQVVMVHGHNLLLVSQQSQCMQLGQPRLLPMQVVEHVGVVWEEVQRVGTVR